MDPEKCGYLNAESSCFGTPFESQRVHGSQTLLKLTWQHFYPNFSLIQDKLSQKTYILVRSEILVLFDNTLTVSHMYSRHNREKFLSYVEMPLSQKLKIFSETFIAFLKSRQTLRILKKRGELHSLNIQEVIGSEKCRYLNTQKLLFQNTLRE